MIRDYICPNGHKGRVWLPFDAVNTEVTCLVCNVVDDVKYLIPRDLPTREELERKEYERLKKIYDNPVGFIAEYRNVKLSFWQKQYLKLIRRIKR